MYDVLDGIRVVEVAEWTFVPAAGSTLSDWGAEVIKIEHPVRADPQRGLVNALSAGRFNSMFEVANRGKRSVGLDISRPEGRELLSRLIDRADVFLTSLMPDARRRLSIEPDDVLARNPRIIYARGTGHGINGPLADQGGYDWASTWCRAGIAHRMTPPGGEPPFMPGSIGDLTGGIALAGAVAAALVRRATTGKGAVVDTSLYGIGAWIMCQAIVANSQGLERPFTTQANPLNPIVNIYRTRDDRWICLCLLQERWWPELCKRLGREDLLDDPRFDDQAARNTPENRDACIRELQSTFEAHDYREWLSRLEGMEGVWAPLQSVAEVAADPNARVNGIVAEVSDGEGNGYLGVSSPAQFDEEMIGTLEAAPAAWEHTEEVLLDLGLTWDDLAELKIQQVIA